MALTLPTITVNDPLKEARLMAAFPAADGLTQAQVYKRWLAAALTARVIESELNELRADSATQAALRVEELQTLLDGAT